MAEPSQNLMPLVFAVGGSINQFGFELQRRLRRPESNMCFSPAGIAAAMAMLYFGAVGRTRSEMHDALHYDLGDPLLLDGFAALTTLLRSAHGNCRLSFANRLWGQETYSFNPDYLKLTRERFGAELARLDFSDIEPARQTINGWIAERTENRIRELIPSDLLDPDVRLVLTNAVYFLGRWQNEFPKEATADLPFHRLDGETVDVPTMHRSGKYRYAESDDVQVLALPYRGPFSMLIVLPKDSRSLTGIEDWLTTDQLKAWLLDADDRTVHIYLPRFRIAFQAKIARVLASMGLSESFGPNADLSGIADPGDEPPLRLSEAIHEAFVDVNEEGTEAAAAFAAITRGGYARKSLEPVEFRADRPFLFLIRHDQTGVILFLGRVTDPSKPSA